MRRALVLLHRYLGLLMAGFLIVSGLTGAVISWDHELDEWLNSHLIHAPDTALPDAAARPSPLDFVDDIERRHPEVQVTYFPLAVEAGHSLDYWVEPRIDRRTGELARVDFNQVFIHPVTGEELGTRQWGAAWPLSGENIVSFLYKLHYSLHIPEMYGIDHWGIWLLGGIGLLWTLDCFIGFYLTLPARKRPFTPIFQAGAIPTKSFWSRWRPSWLVRTKGGVYKLNFDLHRAGGLWTWPLLFVIAFTGFSMNLHSEVFEPAITLISDVTPSVWTEREPRPQTEWREPKLSFADVLKRAPSEARARGFVPPPGHIFYSREHDIYSVAFFHPEDGHGAGGVGHQELFFAGSDGSILGERRPWHGTAADVFVQAQFPLHSGRILGMPGRILISLMGLVVAALSGTGVYIWFKKRVARVRAATAERRRRSAEPEATTNSEQQLPAGHPAS